jgi:hypothetical protein
LRLGGSLIASLIAPQVELASELLQRAIWCHEAAVTPGFVNAWLAGGARMLGSLPANRPFFHALHKYTVAVSRRGCPKAAVALASLLLSLDRTDPTRIRCWLDILCLRASEPARVWLHALESPEACDRLPGFALSHALALHELAAAAQEGAPNTALAHTPFEAAAPPAGQAPSWADGGRAQLSTALLTFPQLLPTALQACAASSAPATKLAARWRRVFGEVSVVNCLLMATECMLIALATRLWRGETDAQHDAAARVPSHGGLVADETLNRRTSGLTKPRIFTPLG